MSSANTALAKRARTSFSMFVHLNLEGDDPGTSVLAYVETALAMRPKPKASPRKDVLNAPPLAGFARTLHLRPAFTIGRYPTAKVEIVMPDDVQAYQVGREIHRVLTSESYAEIYPKVQLTNPGNSGCLETTRGGQVFVRKFGDPGPADHAPDLLIIVGPQDKYDVADPASRNATFAEFQATISHVAPTGAVLLLTPRMDRDDITGQLAKAGQFTIWKFPVIAEAFSIFQCGERGLKILPGTLLHPNTWDEAAIALQREVRTKAEFAAQYMQAPLDSDDRD